jgi:hypothetical protein
MSPHYRRVHTVISRVTPLGFYDALYAATISTCSDATSPRSTGQTSIRSAACSPRRSPSSSTRAEARRLAGLSD